MGPFVHVADLQKSKVSTLGNLSKILTRQNWEPCVLVLLVIAEQLLIPQVELRNLHWWSCHMTHLNFQMTRAIYGIPMLIVGTCQTAMFYFIAQKEALIIVPHFAYRKSYVKDMC